jgi:hypothetical protein
MNNPQSSSTGFDWFSGGWSQRKQNNSSRKKQKADAKESSSSEAIRENPRGLLKVKNLSKYPRTKSEAAAIKIFEGIIDTEMPTVNPRWLVWKGRTLELDGYASQKKVALEFSGPLHTKWFPEKEPYEDYFERVIRDVVKKRLCKKNGVTLVTVDMSLPQHHWSNYIRSRLFDAKRYDLIGIDKLEDDGIPPTPHYYINEQNPEPFRNAQLEAELGMDKEYQRATRL